jgi:hypothetical protein
LQLTTAADVRLTLEALNKACYGIYRNHQSEIEETGNTNSYGWGYVVRVVQLEVKKRSGAPDFDEQIKAMASNKGFKTRAQKAGG